MPYPPSPFTKPERGNRNSLMKLTVEGGRWNISLWPLKETFLFVQAAVVLPGGVGATESGAESGPGGEEALLHRRPLRPRLPRKSASNPALR